MPALQPAPPPALQPAPQPTPPVLPPDSPALRLWGVPALHGARVVRFAAERRFQLVVLLALTPGQWVQRDRAAALLWPDAEMADARRNLRKVLLMARALAGSEALQADAQALRWTMPTDFAAFEAARSHPAESALAWRSGPPLQGLDDARNGAWSAWLAAARARMDEAWLTAAHRQLLAQATPEARAAVAHRVLEVDALDEAAVAALVQAELAQGRPARAQSAYRRYATALAQELGVEPAHALRDLLTAPNPRPAPTIAPSRAPSNAPSSAPTASSQATAARFIGRRLELRELQGLLVHADCRLLTLLGPGGVGKSSLARHALQVLAPHFAGGVQWLDLQDLGDAAELVPRWAQQLGLSLPATGDPLPQLLGQLPTTPTLLVLDNAEHLPSLPALLQRVLQGAATQRLLVTSRVRLQLADEWLLPLHGLAVPDDDSRDIEVAASFDAVRLFESCARAARRDFSLGEHLDAVIRITEAVAGLPLAIELAAGWVRLMPPAEIERDLRASMDLLQQHPTERPDTARAEHRSLRHVLDRSVALLSPAERQALAALSVFQGGFGADAARALGLQATLPLLSALADKSLLSLDTPAGPGRFRLHPLVQAYAAELLAADAATAARMRRAHALHYASFVARLAPLTRTDALQLVQHIESEYGNVLAAWREALALQDAALLGQIVRALWVSFELGCRLQEGVLLLRPALDVLATQAAQKRPEAAWALARLRHGLSMLLHRLGQQEDGLAVAEAGIAAGLEGAELEAHCGCILNAGSCLWMQGRAADAHARFEQALALARAHADRHCIAWALGNLNVSHLDQGRGAEALACAEEALAIDRELGNQYQVAVHLINLATTHFDQRHYERAVELNLEAMAHGQRCRLMIFARHAQGNLCASLLTLGRFEDARPHVDAVLAHARATGQHGSETRMLAAVARIEMATGNEAAALAALREALRLVREHRLAVELLHTLRGFARLLAARGDRVGAAQVLDTALAHPLCTPALAKAFGHTREELGLDAGDEAQAKARALPLEQVLAWLDGRNAPP